LTCASEATERRSDEARKGSTPAPPRIFPPSLRRLVASSLLLLLPLPACQKALFPKDEPRTQFDLHDRTTGYSPPLEHYDVFGNPQPALRERLTQPQ
jgi:hypothetical protein